VKRPWLFRLFLITVLSDSKTELTCFFDRPVSFEMCARMSDLVGAELFLAAILMYLLVVLRAAGPRLVCQHAKNTMKTRLVNTSKPIFADFFSA
jgi:hypothetical protein